ncbi:GFA family protein [Shewanella sp. AS16]|uniref:GFA family protein n=1 Tax=Shewanella sp. AS16 TaxID=2907625 RepID=UPI001F44F02D|nr:GFA family protein [Shewanella sp. AS16]MCE9685016.1 GFA family protein [Shewanella sp. AS16]
MQRHAGCSCGQLTLIAKGEPVRVSVCHCSACQIRTGSAFGVQVRFPLAQVQVSGVSKGYRRRGDSGGLVDFHFCPDCGATLYFFVDSQPKLIAIPAGNFARDRGDDSASAFVATSVAKPHGSPLPPPTVSVYDCRRAPWVRLEGIDDVYD